jgi:hypothetical protein
MIALKYQVRISLLKVDETQASLVAGSTLNFDDYKNANELYGKLVEVISKGEKKNG